MEKVKLFLVISGIYHCSGVSLQSQLEHIAKSRAESRRKSTEDLPSRRSSFYKFDPRELSSIVGVPSSPSHLPEAEPVLPGHTLLRPALGMLKSAVKFPHRELENGAGVYGNFDNLGLRYDAKNERVLYTGFRRSPSDYIMVLPTKHREQKPKFKIASAVLDLDRKDFREKLLEALNKMNVGQKGNIKIVIASLTKNEDISNSHTENYYLHDKLHNRNKKWRWDSAKTEGHDGRLKRFVPVHSKYLYNLRGIPNEKPVLRNQNEALNVQSSADVTLEDGVTEKNANETPKPKLVKIQKDFDHLLIDENAPEHNELVPKAISNEKLRKWWFYNQNDFKEFSGERRLL